jgi:hypothetical protein
MTMRWAFIRSLGEGGAARRETRVSGIVSAPASNRCTLAGAAHSRTAWSSDVRRCPGRAIPMTAYLIVISVALMRSSLRAFQTIRLLAP